VDICIQDARGVSFFCECCCEIDGNGAFTDSAFAAYDSDLVLNLAHAHVKLLDLMPLFKESLSAGF
jgi:hypothetical protein